MNQDDGEVLKGTAASSSSTTTIAPYVYQPPLWSLEYTAGIREREIRQVEREKESDRWREETPKKAESHTV